jgi:uncharacterized protein (DUF2235 family)
MQELVMSKNLVLFSDGTGNSAAKLFKTNIWRLYQAVELKDPQNPKQPRQFAFYDDGVGTSSFRPLALLGGAFGVGLSRNVVDLYVFLCRMYEPGDRIYAFGFSRGAFTIRVLTGLVMCEGLLRYDGNEADLRRLALDAYRAYRGKSFKSGNPLVGLLRGLRDTGLGLLNRALGRKTYAKARRVGEPGSRQPIEIEFLGLWDTVDAYGLPVDELTRAIDRVVWPLEMRDYNLNPRVRRACHALALDDERNAFHPRLWNEVPDEGDDRVHPRTGVPDANRHTTHIRDERISQVWFAGVHSNVGGGYANDGLAYVSLLWMLNEAKACELRFEPSIWRELAALADENGPLYDSRHGLAGYYRYNPRRIDRLANTPKVKIARTKVHESVLRRIQAGHDGYAPIALPPDFAVVRINGDIVDGEAYLRQMPQFQGAPVPAGQASTPMLDTYAADREMVFNTVWQRRIAYFLTLFVSLGLMAMPLFAPGSPACEGSLCVLTKPIALLGVLLPSFATTWTASFASHPGTFLFLTALLGAFMAWGKGLEVSIRDQMRRIWYGVQPLKPQAVNGMPGPNQPGALARGIERMRNHLLYQRAFHMLTHVALPAAFLFSLLYGAGAMSSKFTYAWQASGGRVCKESPEGRMPAGGAAQARWFDTREACWNTGMQLRQGATYRIRISVPPSARWADESIAAGPNGFECPLQGAQAVLMAAAVPMRRHLTEPWFQPIARIGTTGNDTYVLQGDPSTPARLDRCGPVAGSLPPAAQGCPAGATIGPDAEVFESVVVARSSGPLFLYVNDAVPLPLLGKDFYANNRGCARIDVTPVTPPQPVPSGNGLG